MNAAAKPYGIIAEFETPADVLHAAEKVRKAGFRRWDVFTPCPIHGMDRAMGMTLARPRTDSSCSKASTRGRATISASPSLSTAV